MAANNPDNKAIITCAVTGVLTDPAQHNVPVTPKQMAEAARQARDAGAAIVHLHFRRQEDGMGRLPTWDTDVVQEICNEIKVQVPDIILNFSTGVPGDDISGPVACLETVKPEMAALNAGSLNYLKLKSDGKWAWPPMLFDNSVAKIEQFVAVMDKHHIAPECECFDTGIVRSVKMFRDAGILKGQVHVSLVMGVGSGMPAKAAWLPLLIDEMDPDFMWQTIAIGREEVWDVHKRTAELGGHLRTGLEDTFYLPTGDRATSNGQLIEALAKVARAAGREPATPDEARLIGKIGAAFH
jgi:3-keto-5-aminohexanoate cleavage enzyme